MKGRPSRKKIDLDTFLRERQKVVSMWPTGKEVDLDEAIEYKLVSIAYQLDTEVKERKKWILKYGTKNSMEENF